MTGRSIVRIEQNDSDLRFRDKVNANFVAVASRAARNDDVIQLIADSQVVADILLAMNDKVSQSEFDTYSDLRQSGHVDVAGFLIGARDTHFGEEISFDTAYASLPKVMLTPYTHGCLLSIESVTTTGFIYNIFNVGDDTVSAVRFDWMAVP